MREVGEIVNCERVSGWYSHFEERGFRLPTGLYDENSHESPVEAYTQNLKRQFLVSMV
jgi:hypothetical protein